MTLTLVSFNTNGIRTREHQLEELRVTVSPDIIGIQETKVQDQDFPIEMIESLGYKPYYFGQKTHYGVALLCRHEPLCVEYGFPGDAEDAQRRMIIGTFALEDGRELKVINGYFPQGESREHPVKFPAKEKFYADLQSYLENQCDPSEPVVVMGDFNIAPEDIDIGIGQDNAKRWLRTGKASFLPEEREWYQKLLDWGLVDSYRQQHGDRDDLFSWFDYRSRGFEAEPKRGLRIDHILCTEPLVKHIVASDISYGIRGMTKPSDHAPIWTRFEF